MFRKAVITGTVLACLASVSAASASTAAPRSAPGGQVTVSLINENGTGCAPGTATATVSPDNTAFTVSYSTFLALVGVGAGPIDFRKNCEIEALVHMPQGFTYAITEADYRGFASLAAGASGYERAQYFFQGMSATPTVTHNISGPFVNTFQAVDDIPLVSLVYLPCGEQRYLNIDQSLFLNRGWSAPGTTSLLSLDSTDVGISTVFHISWRTCP